MKDIRARLAPIAGLLTAGLLAVGPAAAQSGRPNYGLSDGSPTYYRGSSQRYDALEGSRSYGRSVPAPRSARPLDSTLPRPPGTVPVCRQVWLKDSLGNAYSQQVCR